MSRNPDNYSLICVIIKQKGEMKMFNSYNNQNPYFNPYFNTPQPQTTMPNMRFNSLQGKSIDNLEVVKAMDIPLDGSVSYFPLVDGSAIVTKQLQQDGTSKITIYKPIEADEAVTTKYATIEDIENHIKSIKIPDIKPLQDDIKTLKKQIRILLDKEE